MLHTTLKTAVRRLTRRTGTAAINLVGLGLACGVALLFGLLALALLRYDATYPGADDVYLVVQDIVTPESTRRVASTWTPLLPAFEAETPAVEAGTRFGRAEVQVEVGGRAGLQDVHVADAAFFEVFPFPFVLGDPGSALAGPGQAVVAADAVQRLFGDVAPAEAVGHTLRLDDASEVVVTGVVDVPRNVSVQFDVLVGWAHAERHLAPVRGRVDDWRSSSFKTYVRLRPGTDLRAVAAGLDALVARSRDGEDRASLVLARSWMAEQNDFPLYARLFLGVALGVLAIAAVNATNLATAQSLERAHEVGVRKTLGAGRGEIAVAYLAEAALVAVPAVLGGLGLAAAALPWFNGLTAGFLTLALDPGDPRLWAALVGLAVLVTLLAGAWPALVLARFRPVETLARRAAARPSARRVRGGLVVLQFTLTAFLLASAVTVHQQVRHLRALGFDFGETPVVVLPLAPEAFADPAAGPGAVRAFRDRLRRDPDVAHAALSWTTPGDCCNSDVVRLDGSERALDVLVNWVEPDYFALYEMDVVPSLDEDVVLGEVGQRSVVVNRAVVEAAGWAEPVGQVLHPAPGTTWTVAGVTEDYAYLPPRSAIRPYVHVLSDSLGSGRLSVRSTRADVASLVARLESGWAETGAQRALDVQFADERYAAEYVPENAVRGLVTYAAGFAVVIALTGLFGLAALLASQRTKEIGVRRVLGATVLQVAALLTRGPAAHVLLAIGLAAPLVVVAMRAWLSQFPYRIALGAGPLVLVGAVVLAATVVVVGVQAVRAARADPVRALRTE